MWCTSANRQSLLKPLNLTGEQQEKLQSNPRANGSRRISRCQTRIGLTPGRQANEGTVLKAPRRDQSSGRTPSVICWTTDSINSFTRCFTYGFGRRCNHATPFSLTWGFPTNSTFSSRGLKRNGSYERWTRLPVTTGINVIQSVRDDSQVGKLLAYGSAITRLEWQFAAERNTWSGTRILTAKQARRWKERELQLAIKERPLQPICGIAG